MLKTYEADNLNHKRIKHGFFTRLGGVSTGIYEGLNVGLGSKDDTANVHENRRLATHQLGGEKAILQTVYQIHSRQVVTVDQPWQDGANPEADALVTNKAGIVLGILTADCAPVLFADPKAKVIGAAHSGWKGSFGNVVEHTLRAMEALGAKRKNIHAAIGPCIKQESYEVGPDFFKTAMDFHPANLKFLKKNDAGRYQFDLTGHVERKLRESDIESIAIIDQDTYRNADEFYSYRRMTHKNEADYGRQLSAICLEL